MPASITDVSVQLPGLGELIDVLLLRAGFNSKLVLTGTTFLGIAAGVVGAFTLLRKRALMGDALAHSTLPGLVMAYIITAMLGFQDKNLAYLLLGATISGVLGVMTVQVLSRYTRLQEDTSIGAVLSVFFGIGIVLLSIVQSMQSTGAAGLNHFIYGQTAAMRISDAYLIISVALLVSLSAFFLSKEFSLISFDPDFAVVQGWSVNRIDLIMMTLVTLVTVIGLQSVGIILVISLLIIPASAARFWTERLSVMIILSAFIGGLSGYIGAAASTLLPRLPAGAVIVLMSGTIFCISFLLAPKRGVIVGLYRLAGLKIRVTRDHLYRDIYETYEKNNLGFEALLSLNKIPYIRQATFLKLNLYVLILKLFKIVRISENQISFTEKGLKEAKKLIRNHRLWEQYIFEYGAVSTSHVDYSADFAEHVLSSDIIEKIEVNLKIHESESLHPLGDRS